MRENSKQTAGTNPTIEQENRKVLERQAQLIDLAPAATIVRDLDGTIRFWSEGAVRLYGIRPEEALGRKTHELLRTQFPEPLDVIIARSRAEGRWIGELQQWTKDGRLLIVESHWLAQFAPDGTVEALLESNIDITERRRTENELRRLKEHLELLVQERTAELAAANRELESFAYTVSHDLRAPLRHVSAFARILREDAAEHLEERERHYLELIAQGAERMDKLIDNLLTLSRLGRAPLHESEVELGPVVADVREELAPETLGRAIEWRIGPLPTVRGDPTLLRSALSNLLSNAIKYTRGRQPARIEVGGARQNGTIVCFVRDNGVGFDMAYADKLFGVFQRLHKDHEFEGSGIGLASVRRIIQRHGGRTWAEGAVDQGATFYFSLPEDKHVAATPPNGSTSRAQGKKLEK